jgi:thiamine biosynthesis lipoprotein
VTTPWGPISFPALGTTAVLVVWSGEGALQDVARRVLEEELAAIDRACSRFRDDSELTAANRAAGEWAPASALFLEAVEVGLRAARHSDGAVDPTLGVAMRVLGYDRDFAAVLADVSHRRSAPDGPPLQLTLAPAPAWRQVAVDRRGGRMRVPAGAELDLGATAKALAADRAAAGAAGATGAGVLVNLGGDVSVAGPPPPGGWLVHVTDDHRSTLDAPGQTVSISSGGLATSSVTTRAWSSDGESVHHVVDPTTGRPAAGPWRTVSVAAATCVDANTAATAALVKGDAAPAWLAACRLPARLVGANGDVVTVGEWPAE